MAKRLTTMLLALALCLSLMPLQAYAIQGQKKANILETDYTGKYVYNYGSYCVIEKGNGAYQLVSQDGICREANAWMAVDTNTGIFIVSGEAYYQLPDGNTLFTKEQMEANVKAFLEENYPMGEIVSLKTKIMKTFSEGYASNSFEVVYRDGEEEFNYEFFALIDSKGLVHYATPLISLTAGGGFPIWWALGSCKEGLVQFVEEYTDHDDKVWTYEFGFMDTDGNEQVVWSDNGSRDPDDPSVTVYDLDGYTMADNYHNGVTVIYNEDGKCALVDRSGKLLTPFEHGLIHNDTGSYPVVYDQGKGYGYIDTAGQIIIPQKYDYAAGSYGLLFTVEKDGKCGVIDEKENVIVPFEYEAMSSPDEGIVYAIKGGKVYVITFEDVKEDSTQKVSEIFTDVPAGAWYEGFLQNAYDSSIVGGKGNGIYDPDGQLKHGEIMVMVTNLHAKMKGEPFVPAPNPTDHWARAYCDYCKAEGIIDGRFDNKLNDLVTREEMAYYFANTLTPEYYKDKMDISFTDIAGNPYEAEIMKLAKADIVGGKGSGIYDPAALIKRSEAAVFVSNILAAIGSPATVGPVGGAF